MSRRHAYLCGLLPTLMLAACGGGGGGSGGQVQSTPAPISVPPPGPISTPAATDVEFDTSEFQASSGPSFHGAITAYEAGASGAGVLVGIVDSGITDATGEFTGRISPLSRDFAGNGSYQDVGGHGTAVAETLAGARNDRHVHGMAWGATVLALRTDLPGTCAAGGCEHTASAMAQAIDYAWRSGARVINLSLGGDVNSADLRAAVSRATAAGTIIVVAAGNAPSGTTPSATPDLLASAIAHPSVGHGLVIIATSVGRDGTVSSFSDGVRGFESSALAALGESVLTINHQGTDLLYTGTSFSAPQIAGAAALLAQAFPNLTGAQIVQLLLGTARDAGATGPDAAYGVGILDIDRAFRPQGAVSLAGSSVALTPGAPTTLSAAMGDANATGLGAVILDSYNRPFRTDLSLGMERPGLRSRLTAMLAGTSRQIRGEAGPLSLAFNIAPGLGGAAPLALDGRDARGARFLSGMVSARMSPAATVALGLRSGLDDVMATLAQDRRPAFLTAERGAGAMASEMRAGTSLAWRQQIGPGLALLSGIEMGEVDAPGRRRDLLIAPFAVRDGRYQAIVSALSLDRGRIGLTAGLRLVNEPDSMLGARFAPMLGAQSARSLFASLEARVAPAERFVLAASMQRGWTRAAAGGALDQGGLLRSRSWSLDATRTSLFTGGDMIGLRIAAPLRVTGGRFALNLPQSWDWESETATLARTPLDLAPRGSERDYELSYGLGVSGGWLGANLFLRSEAGNIAATPDDYGAALRWNVRW